MFECLSFVKRIGFSYTHFEIVMNNFDLKIGKMEQRNAEDTALFKLLRERLDNNNTDIEECVKIYNG